MSVALAGVVELTFANCTRLRWLFSFDFEEVWDELILALKIFAALFSWDEL